MTKSEIDKEIKHFDKNVKKGTLEHWAYRALLTFPQIGPFKTRDEVVDKTLKFWGQDEGPLSTMCVRAWQNKVVRFGPRNQKKYLDGEIYEDGLGLALGACVLSGLMNRVNP
jgi:hypothetical protein